MGILCQSYVQEEQVSSSRGHVPPGACQGRRGVRTSEQTGSCQAAEHGVCIPGPQDCCQGEEHSRSDTAQVWRLIREDKPSI